MGCGASRISFRKGRQVSVTPQLSTAQTHRPPLAIEVSTEEPNDHPDTYGGDSRPSEKPKCVTTIAEIEVPDTAADSHSTSSQPEPQHQEPTLTPTAADETLESHSGDEERESSAPDGNKKDSAGEKLEPESTQSHQTAATTLPETRKADNFKKFLTSHAVVFEDLQTKSLNHIELLGKSDKDSSPLKSMSATVILTKHTSHGKQKENEAKLDEVSQDVSITSQTEHKGTTQGTGVHSGARKVEETAAEGSQVVEKEVTDTINDGERTTEELHAMTKQSETVETVQVEDTVAETAVKEIKSTETQVEEVRSVESTSETVESTAKEEMTPPTEGPATVNTTVGDAHATDTSTKGGTETCHVDETPQQTKSTMVTEDKAASEKSEDVVIGREEKDKSVGQSRSCTTSRAELDRPPSATMGSKSSLSKMEGNQMVEKIEIDHSTGQSQASLVEAVEKAVPPPVVTNT